MSDKKAKEKYYIAGGAVIVALLLVCVGLLIALLKNQPKEQTHQPATATTPVLPITTVAPGDNDYRLPSDIVPLHYDVLLNPDLDKGTFTGTVTITVVAEKQVSAFAVHVYYRILNVTLASVTNSANAVLGSYSDTSHHEKELYILRLNQPAPIGTYKLKYEFQGTPSGDNLGFYRSSYTESGVKKFLATSKFQPTYARRAFPCFDEPSFKSNFTVTLVHQKGMTALSNMPAATIQDTRTVFEESVPMVTYLACFIISDFEALGSKTTKGKDFKVYATPGQKHKTKFALDNGIKMLDFYEKYFEIDYPLPKLDMIAIPDFQSGAMEHWGLITYRETNLLYDEKESSPQNKQRVATVIAHELAHMWFGNLVTMKWWDDLWLNEGFASYIEYKGVDSAFSEWKMMDQLLTEDLQPVMRLDATTSSHPIIQPVKSPDQITEIFDAISYNKGAAVLHMLENFVGDEVFRKGIKSFLEKYQYKNADTEQLWAEIETANNKKVNVSGIMHTWTKQMGFPVVTVKRVGANRFTVRQKRFLTNPNEAYNATESPYEYIWKIPLYYVTSKGKTDLIWLNEEEETFDIKDLLEDDWVKFNHKQWGYYLVNYELKDWETFSSLVLNQNEVLTAKDRAGLLFDSFMLAQAQMVKYDIPLNLVKSMVKETDLTPWESAYSSLVHMGHLFPDQDLKNFVRDLTSPLYRKLGWKTHENHVDSLLQTTIVGLACYSGNTECKNEAVKKMKLMMENKDPEVPLTLRNTVFHYAMEMGGSDTEWMFLWDKYEGESSAQERLKLLYGMAHVKDPTLITKLLNYAKDPNKIRTQDFFTVLTYIAGNPDGRDIVWTFVRDNWGYLVQRFTTNNRDLGRAVKNICDYFNTEEKLEEMEMFFSKYPDAGAGARARQQALENVRNNIYWMRTHQTIVDNWLSDNGEVAFSNFRLNDDVLPLHYDLMLKPNLEEDTFEGSVKITVKIAKRTQYLIVQSHLLTVTSTNVATENGTAVPMQTVFPVPDNQLLVTQLKTPARKDAILVIKFEFRGNLSGRGLVGFYRSSYKAPDGKTRYLATSQFQSTYARQAFPCFDEPQFKSKFNVTLVHPVGYKALSNMPQYETKKLDTEWSETKFEESVPMVTYLVAVIVCDFEFTEGKTKNNKIVRVFARPAEKDKTKYALDIGIKTLEYFQEYFKIDYPLPKLDMIAIPDFQAGAMENWGLVTYRETLLLFDASETSSYGQLRIDAVIGHELAHMWFGNLVTMKWWDDLWLNEGFASYIEYKSMEKINPEWDVDAQFFFEDIYRVLIPDAAPTSHPIVQSVGHPDEITAIFDAISYSKGASVLRMLEFFIGTETFKRGVTSYLRKFSYGNAVTADLWSHLEQAAHEVGQNIEVSKVMDTWTRQMGYPYINISKYDEGSSNVYLARPGRFLIDPHVEADNTSPYGYKWEIPLSYKTSENATSTIQWIHSNMTALKVTVDKVKWIKFNSDSKCYYLVNYREEWPAITNQLVTDHQKLSASDRANLISDVFLLSRAGITPYSNALELTSYLKNESHFVPWETARRSFSYLLKVLKHEEVILPIFKNYLKYLTEDALSTAGWKDDGQHLQKRLRVSLVELACDSDSDECLKQTGRMLKDWKENNTALSPNFRLLVFRYGMQESGDDEMWEFMLNKYKQESSSQVQRDLLHGMSFSKNPDTIERLLELANNSTIRDQDYFTVLGYIASNPVGLPIVWKYVKENWLKLVERFSLNDRYLGDMVRTVCGHFTTKAQLTEMEAFFSKYPDAGAGERARKDVLETVKNSILWLEKYKDNIRDWISTEYPWFNVRLPRHIKPLHYDLELHPNIAEGNFTGHVHIMITTTEPSPYLLVHTHDLKVLSSQLTEGHSITGNDTALEYTFNYEANQFWVLKANTALPAGNYTMYFEFEGSLLNKLVGFYRSSYTDTRTGEIRHLATSQFQSTYARQAFPCLDEPGLKSTFTVALVHESNMTALSNMPIDTVTQRSDNLTKTKFETSVKMVTYLVAVIVCDFDYKEVNTTNGTTIRVYAPADRVHQVDFGLESGKKILEYFENYFQIEYPLPKLDMIGLPDFRAGAMENWGLITYREVYMLFNETETSPNVEFSIFMIIAHEIAHMWFGNLVTTEWWDDLWLNEGFATFMAHKCVNELRPDMDGIGLFMLGQQFDVLEPDATWSSHPIVTEVHNPDQISAIFDAISYGKGASVLRKLESFLKPEVFRKGITNFLNKYQFANAKTDALWEELTKVSQNLDSPVKDIMDTWTRQMGYPVITVQSDSSQNSMVVDQKRFLLNPDVDESNKHPSPFNYKWRIPIHYKKIKASEGELVWLNEKNGALQGLPKGELVKLNADNVGFYLVDYLDSDWDEWAKVLNKQHIMQEIVSRYDRANLLNDAFLLAPAGYLNYTKALELTVSLESKEDEFLPWNTGKSALVGIASLLREHNETYDNMKKFLQKLSEPKFNSLSWSDHPDQNYTERRLRVTVADLACRSGLSKCLDEASTMLDNFLNNNIVIPSALRSLAYKYGVSQNGLLWDQLWEKYKEATSAQEKRDMLVGLAYVKDDKKLNQYLEYAINEDLVRTQDFFTVLNNIAANPDGLEVAWNYYKDNWDELVQRHTLNAPSLGGSFRSITSHFTTEGKLKEMKDFIAKYPKAGAGAADRAEALEIVESNIRWSDKYISEISNWLAKRTSL